MLECPFKLLPLIANVVYCPILIPLFCSNDTPYFTGFSCLFQGLPLPKHSFLFKSLKRGVGSCPLTIRKLVKIFVIGEYVLKADVIELLKKLEDRLGLMDGQ